GPSTRRRPLPPSPPPRTAASLPRRAAPPRRRLLHSPPPLTAPHAPPPLTSPPRPAARVAASLASSPLPLTAPHPHARPPPLLTSPSLQPASPPLCDRAPPAPPRPAAPLPGRWPFPAGPSLPGSSPGRPVPPSPTAAPSRCVPPGRQFLPGSASPAGASSRPLKTSHRFKQVAKGFMGKMIPSKERLFQGSTSTGSRHEALLRCVDPNLQGVPIALQRNEGEEDEEAEGEDAGDRQEGEEAGDRLEDEEAGDGQEDAQADEELMGGDGSEEVVQRRGTRRSHYVNPPPIPAAVDKKLMKPNGDRTPNGLLGNLIRVHNPGVVEKNGETIPVITWKHFALAPHVMYGSVQGLVRYKFWKYYCVNPSEQDHPNKVTNSWLKSQGQPVGRFRDASETYLTAEEYGSISHPLFEDQPGPYKALCDLWASEEFQERSRKHRNAGTKNATHKLGGDRYCRKAQRSAEYGKEIQRRHGEGFDWRTALVDPQAVYESGGSKSHGRYSMFNGMIDSRQSSGGTNSRQRRTTSEKEIDSLRQEIQKRDAFLKAQEEYQKKQQAHAERLHAQQMAAIQAIYQAQGWHLSCQRLHRHQYRHSGEWIGSAGVESLPNSSASLRTTWRSEF
ncbi:hypothetical protein U9M48_013833, partial [Paspalum notatum var. saurae]